MSKKDAKKQPKAIQARSFISGNWIIGSPDGGPGSSVAYGGQEPAVIKVDIDETDPRKAADNADRAHIYFSPVLFSMRDTVILVGEARREYIAQQKRAESRHRLWSATKDFLRCHVKMFRP